MITAACALLVAGCGAGDSSPTAIAHRYEQAIFSRNGGKLCATFAPKLREVIGEQVADEQAAAGSATARFDCGRFYHLLIGYPHENIDKQFTSGKLLDVGKSSDVRRRGVLYVKVPARLRFDYVYTGYTSHRRGEKGTTTFEDAVWLAKDKDRKWGVVKPSLALVAATSSPQVLDERFTVARLNAPPPDPDYSMNRAERTASEKADYEASFRRRLLHSPLKCAGRPVSVEDPLHDAVTYPTGSALHPAPGPNGNDIERVTVQAAGHTICVAVTFRKKPSDRLDIGFTPRARRLTLPEYIVELIPRHGVRGGGLTASYRYFRGGTRLIQRAVKKISLYRSTVAFVADANVARPGSVSAVSFAGLYWDVRSSAASGADVVPNGSDTDYVVIRQSDGRRVKPNN